MFNLKNLFKKYKKTYYVCEGECGVRLSEKEYQSHPTKACPNVNCSHYQKLFTKKPDDKNE